MSDVTQIITVTFNTAIDRVLEVPDFAVGGHVPGRRIRRYVAGKGINVSRALAHLSRASIAAGLVGRGQYNIFERSLGKAGPGRVTCQLLAVDGATRENITIVDPRKKTDTHIREAGFVLKDADRRRIRSKVAMLAREGSVLVFAGSLPPGMATNDLRDMVSDACAAEARVALDVGGETLTYLHDSWRERRAAAMGAGGAGGAAGDQPIWMVKPNRDELLAVTESKEDKAASAASDDAALLHRAHQLTDWARWVVVTLGAEGAWLIGRDAVWRGRVNLGEQRVVNTVGCGDCLLAGMLDVLCERGDADPPEMLRNGLATATANALTPAVAEFEAEAVAEMAGRVEIEQRPAVST